MTRDEDSAGQTENPEPLARTGASQAVDIRRSVLSRTSPSAPSAITPRGFNLRQPSSLTCLGKLDPA